METLMKSRVKMKRDLSFNVDPKLLDLVQQGDPHANFQIGMQALNEKRFGFAIAFLNFAWKAGY